MRPPACLLLLALVAGAPAMEATDREAALAELADIADDVGKLSRAFNLIHQVARPSVVQIHIRTQVIARFSRRAYLREVPAGEGSGFVFASDDKAAYVLTNAHVVVKTDDTQDFLVGRAGQPVPFDNIRVTSHDNRIMQAVFLGADVDSDLAVLRIDAPDLPPVQWSDSDRSQVGDWVVALGFPLGVGYSASSGIISAIARSTDNNEHNLEAYIQTDAAINPGNSGGPLLDLRGRVVGVNTRIISQTRLNIGLGFAIPANLARRVGEDLRHYGRVYRPMIGFQMRPLQPGEAEDLAIPNPQGVVVTLAFPGTPSTKAGMRMGDVILRAGGVRVSGINHLRTIIASAEIGNELPLEVWRDGQLLDLTVIPLSKEEVIAAAQKEAEAHRRREVLLREYGLTLTADDRIGVIAVAVEEGSPAAEAGLHTGDRIIGVRGYGTVTSPDEFISLAQRNPALVCNVYRDGRTSFVILRKRE